MTRRQIKIFTFLVLLTCLSLLITNGDAAFGDYKKRIFSNINHTTRKKMINATQNVDFQTPLALQKSKKVPRRENFDVQEVRLYETNPTPMFQDREKKMLDSLLSGKTIQPGQSFDSRKQIYGPELQRELDSLLEHTSPNWDKLDELLKQAEKITRLPQSMYYDEEETKLPESQSGTLQTTSTAFTMEKKKKENRDVNIGDILKQKLQKLEADELSRSVHDFSMDFGGGQQIYPFGPDISLSDVGMFRGKREVNVRNNFSSNVSTREIMNYRLLRDAQELHNFKGPPLTQFPETTKKLINFRAMKEREVNPLKNTKPTEQGTLDNMLKEAMKQLNPIQQKIIQDLFSYGPRTTLSHNLQQANTSLPTPTERKRNKPVANSLFVSTSLLSVTSGENLKSITPRRVTIDETLMQEWLKSLNPQDQKEIEKLFFNGSSSPLQYDFRNVESIKNAFKNEFLREERKTEEPLFTNNPKSTFIFKNNKKKYATENLGNYNYEDVSRLLKEAPQDKLKIVNDWCDEIARDLHRRFPTATLKEGETREPGPFPATRYYPWELFSMLPQNN